ncbi:AAA family ATPase [Exiguobacterium profundum]|uniref:AAA family ATPase n=1 Tax=Exiguobacterium TaxID=33986 RepID=UPI001BFCAB5E|nr:MULTISPECIES: ATP-binding protein [Exiguobacterium]MCT4798868.1 ATP-binding protein [Exiguobacterium profundum]
MNSINDFYINLAKLAVEERKHDSITLIKKSIKHFKESDPIFADQLNRILTTYQNRSNVFRKNIEAPLPIDLDSKLELVKKNFMENEKNISWPKEVDNELKKIIKERNFETKLMKNELLPIRSSLFVGEPGVGKTLAAKWISTTLGKPLITLNLAAIMSSYLGKTGNNIRAVIEYAKKNDCILLLDEFDSIAKKRGDDSEVGELKRLVTVLLQEIDDWPSSRLLLAATNHPELLDPAVWRRFDKIIHFPKPRKDDLIYTINGLLENNPFENKGNFVELLSFLLEGLSYSDVTKEINSARKESILDEVDIVKIFENIISEKCLIENKDKKIKVSFKLLEMGYSQKRASEIVGLSRETIRKYTK